MMNSKSDGTEGAGGRSVTERELADELVVSPATVARERKRGNIKAIRPGGRLVRYERAEIEAYKERVRQRVGVDHAAIALTVANAMLVRKVSPRSETLSFEERFDR
jgi:IS30 family transposase